MNPRETLYYRALRILTDGKRHQESVLLWARHLTEVRQQQNVRDLQRAGFTLAEISLGAQEVAR